MSQADAYDTHADHQSFELPQDISFDQLDAFDFDEPGLDVQQLAHTGGDSNTVDGQSRNQASAMRSTQELLLMFGGDDEREQIPEDAHDLDASMSNANVHLQAGHHLQQTVGHQQQQHHQHVQKRLRIDDSQPCLDDDFAFNAQQIQGFTQPSPVNATQEQQSLPVSLFQPSQASEMSQMPSRAPQPALPPAVASKPVPRKQLSLPPLYFPDTNERIALAEQKLTRKGIMPATFDSKEEYRDTLSSLLMEHLQVMLHTIAVKLNQVVMSATTATNDAYLRHRGVPHYSNVKIRPFEVRDERAFRFQPALQARKNNHVLHLPSKEHSSAYSKGDLWVLSTSSTFDGCCIVRSFHYGPSANKTLEVGLHDQVVPMSPRDARMVQDLSRQNKSCFAIRAVNAGSELSMIQCISESLTACPITPALASPHRTIAAADGRNRPSQAAQRGGFKVPTITPKGLIVSSGLDLYHEILEGTVAEYHLNADQATVVRDFAASIADTRRHPVTLVHGVFGAGKSFLVGVVVIFLHRVRQSGLFVDGDRMRIAISSMTNVAVDLILLNLLDLGFTEFVRVGSLSKIAKPVLPYTAQAAKSPSDDIKELKSMLEDTTLTVSERREVQRAIQVFRANENKEAVAKAFVIGTTCLAATFDRPRSACGDPYQLPPTVPSLLDGSPPTAVWPPPPPSPTNTPPHGLEWTLFERLADTSLVPIMLRTQYRCHPLIAQLSSTLFYESRLLNGVDAAQRPPLVPGLPPVSFMAVEAGCESSARGGSTANVVECTLVCDLAWQIIESGVDPSDVGIITLCVSTVDAYQGAEKLVIILSTVRTKSKGFIEDPRRINVALTRAKHVETLDLPGGAADTHTGQDDDYDVFDPAALDF
ncbi:P-loop containing nucleoside triphosphate hydrolase protein [Entophlyctis helioformis]|nr:P-loop containing nucleoside triphosphate hydrolase protein [Entophlyctis helioformis]